MTRSSILSAGARLDLGLAVGLFISALLARLPNLMTVPALTDEFKEVGWALKMIEQNSWPPVAVDAYDGPLFPWLLSVLFRVVGLNLYLPRVLVMIAGALTVMGTYFLAKLLARGDWRAGVAAALLLVVNAHHILFNSHVAWSNDITPFFTTAAILAYLHATREERPRGLVVAAALYGCAVQTHPSALALMPAFVLDFSLRRTTRSWLRSVYPYAAVVAALVVYSPVLYYNLTAQGDSLRQASLATYAFETQPSLAKTLLALGPTVAATGRVALGSMGGTTWNSLWTDPALAVFVLGTGTALVWMARRGEIFPIVAYVTAVVFLATFNHFRAMPDSSRYFQILTPLLFSSWSVLGIAAWDKTKNFKIQWMPWLARGGLALAFMALAFASISSLERYYQREYRDSRTNVSLLAIVETVRAGQGDPVLIENGLNGLRTGRGGDVADNMAYLLQLDRHKTKFVSIADAESIAGLKSVLRRTKCGYLISFPNAPEALGGEFRLDPLVRGHFTCPSCSVSNDFVLFRWENQAGNVMNQYGMEPIGRFDDRSKLQRRLIDVKS